MSVCYAAMLFLSVPFWFLYRGMSVCYVVNGFCLLVCHFNSLLRYVWSAIICIWFLHVYILFWFPYLSVSVCYVVNGLSIPFWWPYPGMLPYRIIFSVCYDVNVCCQYYIHRFSTTLQNIFIKNSVSCKVRVHNSAQHAISPSHSTSTPLRCHMTTRYNAVTGHWYNLHNAVTQHAHYYSNTNIVTKDYFRERFSTSTEFFHF